jgi:two-component system, LytTR family, sensor kinase
MQPLGTATVPLVTGRLTAQRRTRYDRHMKFDRSQIRWYLALFAIFTAIGIFFTFHYYLGDAPLSAVSFRHHLLDEMTGAWGAMVLVPFMVMFARRFPFKHGAVLRPLLYNVAGWIVYTLAHTTIESSLRYVLQPLLGIHETYTEIFSFLQEAAGDAVYYSIDMAAIYLLVRFIATRDIETRLAQAQLENLRLQLQPHFLFNSLNAVSSVMYEDPARADRMLAQISDYMRHVLASGGVQEIPLDEELAMERMYVDIMQTRLERGLELAVRVDDDARGAVVPFMLLQPLLENSIRHGMGSSRERLDLAIGVGRRDGSVVITVSDDGLGYAPGERQGIGLTNVRERLERLYGSRANFEIAGRDGGGTLAVVTLPFRQGGTQ